MSLRTLGAALVLAAVVLSGCTASPPDGTPDARPPADAFAEHRKFELTGCSGLYYESPWFGPPPSDQAPRPEGWTSVIGQAYYYIVGELHRCERIAWGGLERGPVWFGWEDHESYVAPDACVADMEGNVRHRTLHHVLSDDPDVVAHAAALDMPAHRAMVQAGEGSVDSSRSISWSVNGEPESSMEVPLADEDYAGAALTIALFWFDDDGRVYRLALERHAQSSPPASGTATISPPSLLSERPSPQPVGMSWLTRTSWTGALVVFDGPACEHQVEP